MLKPSKRQSLNQTQPIGRIVTRCKTTAAQIDNSQSYNQYKQMNIIDQIDKSSQLSKFDLISWKKRNYEPSNNQQRLKFQNDALLHRVGNEIIRGRSKPVRIQNPTFETAPLVHHSSYKQHYSQLQDYLRSSSFINQQQDQLYYFPKLDSPRHSFRQKHQKLYSFVTTHFKTIGKSETVNCKLTEQLGKSNIISLKPTDSRKVSSDKQSEKIVKMRDSESNDRVVKILNKWRGCKKSINQRFNQIWIKPLQQRQCLIKRRIKTQMQTQHIKLAPITKLQKHSSFVSQLEQI